MRAHNFETLRSLIEGELLIDSLHKIIYSTDASVYREVPLGVVYPKSEQDVITIVKYCSEHKISMIPRAGGTSLAGQCVGSGLVVDISKHMTDIISIDAVAKSAIVQPGVIRDELNQSTAKHNLLFGPNTSTANRATIAGMVGNNSCGSTSIVFGNTRDHVQSIRAVLSDGSLVIFEGISRFHFYKKCDLDTLEGEIYRFVRDEIQVDEVKSEIVAEYPKSSVKRRNTGYAIDTIMADYGPQDQELNGSGEEYINMCKLICGSEGTLCFITEITIGLVDSPPKHELLLVAHYRSIDESLRSVPLIMQHSPFACELMDKVILDCTKDQKMYAQDRHILVDDPAAVMLISFVAESKEEVQRKAADLVSALEENTFGYTHPIISENQDRIWNLRKAGLGLLANLPGDKKAVACIEDTAVAIEDLAAYIREFSAIMNRFGQRSVYYAHAGAGEIHLRPILDLKTEEDRKLFYEISKASAKLVKKYNGSLSGEHGDGRVRAPFIQDMIGERLYRVLQELKSTWDPTNILNPGKIVNAAEMTEDLRYDNNHTELGYETMYDFSEVGGILRAAEKCNGSGDCRKLPLSGGTMCPSFMATRDEKTTTRARANTLREVLTRPVGDNAWNRKELKEAMDLCLSCKGCTSECPSNVDMSKMKSEFLYQYQKENGIPLRARVFANFNRLGKTASAFSGLTNLISRGMFTAPLVKRALGVHPRRSLPAIDGRPLHKRYNSILSEYEGVAKDSDVYFFCDEFTNYNDAQVGEDGLRLLCVLGYNVIMIEHEESGRAAISKGLLDMAKRYANSNVSTFAPLISEDSPLIGIEPSAILTFRDEYPALVDMDLKSKAIKLSKYTFTIEEFIYREVQKGNISPERFSLESKRIMLHGHCHQKALTDINQVAWVLSLPQNYSVSIIPSGCCGMAGSFGYEKEHYDLSMQVGELVLFPAIRSSEDSTIIAASGTSCRHQIKDGVERTSFHPVTLLYNALESS